MGIGCAPLEVTSRQRRTKRVTKQRLSGAVTTSAATSRSPMQTGLPVRRLRPLEHRHVPYALDGDDAAGTDEEFHEAAFVGVAEHLGHDLALADADVFGAMFYSAPAGQLWREGRLGPAHDIGDDERGATGDPFGLGSLSFPGMAILFDPSGSA
jgi:hypothetical protein